MVIRRSLPAFSAAILVAACARRPQPNVVPEPAAAAPATPAAPAPAPAAPAIRQSGVATTLNVPGEIKVDSARVTAADVTKSVVGVFGDSTAVDANATPDSAADAPSWDIEVHPYETTDRVEHYVRLFTGPAKERIEARLERGTRYEPMIRARMHAGGIPEDMYYLALVESGFDPNAYSRAAAVGMWQFMTSTARDMGMRVDWWIDERRDPVKSTDAAVRFIKDLKEQFGSLYLAAAAYNAGAGKVGRGLNRMDEEEDEDGYSDSTFFRLYDTRFIRRETKDYVPKLIAAALIAKEPARYGFHVQPAEPLETDSIVVPDMTGLDVVARLADTTVAAIAELNPQYLRLATPPHSHAVVRVPAGRGEAAARAYAELAPADRVSFREHVVTRGQTTAAIAQRYGISTSALVEANPALRRRAPRAGQRLIVPLGGPMSTVVARRIAEPEPVAMQIHRVRRGETLSGIARRYHVSVRQLRGWNRLGSKGQIRAGQRLRIAAPAVQRARQAEKRSVASRSTTHVTRLAGRSGEARSASTHVVKKGETLTGLARRYGVTVQALRKANGMSARAQLKAGTAIVIPA